VVLEDVACVVCCVVLDVDDGTVAPVLTVVVVLDVAFVCQIPGSVKFP